MERDLGGGKTRIQKKNSTTHGKATRDELGGVSSINWKPLKKLRKKSKGTGGEDRGEKREGGTLQKKFMAEQNAGQKHELPW